MALIDVKVNFIWFGQIRPKVGRKRETPKLHKKDGEWT